MIEIVYGLWVFLSSMFLFCCLGFLGMTWVHVCVQSFIDGSHRRWGHLLVLLGAYLFCVPGYLYVCGGVNSFLGFTAIGIAIVMQLWAVWLTLRER